MRDDFAALANSWDLTLEADGYSPNTRAAYQQALRSLLDWMTGNYPAAGPDSLRRDHVRGWLAELRRSKSANTARGWFAGVRHFCRWLVDEKENEQDATLGIRTPAASDPVTPTLRDYEIKRMLDTCTGPSFTDRRDAALIYVFADGGLRLAEATGLKVQDIDVRDRIMFVIGKGSNRSGPRRRAVQLGVKAVRAVDRYQRVRQKHPLRELDALWLGARNRGPISADGIDAILKRRGARAGLTLHPHMFRHTWASEFRLAGGEEGDLMVLGGWRSRQMLDRYGRAAAGERARAAYRTRSLGDRL